MTSFFLKNGFLCQKKTTFFILNKTDYLWLIFKQKLCPDLVILLVYTVLTPHYEA